MGKNTNNSASNHSVIYPALSSVPSALKYAVSLNYGTDTIFISIVNPGDRGLDKAKHRPRLTEQGLNLGLSGFQASFPAKVSSCGG